MLKLKINVGRYYELKINEVKKISFAVLYGFERGKNRDVYTLMIYDHGKNFEFPIEDTTFDNWVKEGRIKELTADEALSCIV